ncbi:MAG: cupin domain-containing protein [Flavobacteriales bacterium]|nr:cupin domain-containing protein [Flavobacteriales bacterium]
MKHPNTSTDALILPPRQGRTYDCGTMTAVFKADENESDERYSASEWWLQPNSEGPGPHLHEENDELFYVIEGTMSFLVGDRWVDAERGTFLRIPARTMHDFTNRTDKPAAAFNVFIPGGFERIMPSIVKWFAENKG